MSTACAENGLSHSCCANVGFHLRGRDLGQPLLNWQVAPLNRATAGDIAVTIHQFCDTGRDLRASNVQSDCPELLLIVHLQAGCDREGDVGPAPRAAEGQEGESVIAPRWSASPSRPCCRLLLLPASECHARDYEGAGVLL